MRGGSTEEGCVYHSKEEFSPLLLYVPAIGSHELPPRGQPGHRRRLLPQLLTSSGGALPSSQADKLVPVNIPVIVLQGVKV